MSKDTKRRDNKGRVLRTGESQRKDGTYQYRHTQNGKRECIYAPTLKELREKEEDIQRSILENTFAARSKVTLLRAVEIGLATKTNCRRSTMASYLTAYRTLAAQPFMATPISEVTRTNAKLWFASLHDEFRYKKGTLTIFKSLIRSSLESFVDDRVIPYNPFDMRLSFLPNDKENRDMIPSAEWNRFIKFLRREGIGRKYADMFDILYETGMRVGELCGLTVDDVDLVGKRVRVCRQVVYSHSSAGYYVSPPKTSSGMRTIPLTEKAESAFRSVIAHRDLSCSSLDGVSGFLFSSRGHPVSKDIIGGYFRRAIERYNAAHPDKTINATLHCLRHSFASNIVAMGVSPKTSQYLMGHSDVQTTLSIYAHTNEDIATAEFNRVCKRRK